jgi:recombination protein RecR
MLAGVIGKNLKMGCLAGEAKNFSPILTFAAKLAISKKGAVSRAPKGKMNPVEFPSRLLETAVSEFAKLPGIGRKTALRFVLHLLRQPLSESVRLADSVIRLKNEIKFCLRCYNISDHEFCQICTDSSRNQELICVVESIRDVMAIEATMQYRGLYHVLGGIISPMNGIGPADLEIQSLENRVSAGNINEVILALAATIEGDTTSFYINRKLAKFGVEISAIARGVSVGDDLEYTDEITLGRSIINRLKFENGL